MIHEAPEAPFFLKGRRPGLRLLMVSALLSGLLGTALAQDDADLVATVGDRKITEQEVDARIKGQLAQFEAHLYQAKRSAIEAIADDYLIERAAKKAKLGKDDYLKREIDEKAQAPSDEEMQKYYDEHKDQIRQPLDKVKPLLAQFLKNQRLKDRRQDLIAGLRKKAGLKINLEPPRIEVAVGDSPTVGSKDAPVTIVEFSDFQCPFCRRAEDSLKEVRKKYGDKLRVAYRDFPLSIHQHAMKASEAGQCAREQDKFWEFHDAMFADQSKLDDAALKAAAAKLSLDTSKFDDCLDHDKYADKVHKDMADGETAGVTGTPAFFINGRFINGAAPAEQFEEVIDDELSRLGDKEASAR